jgi:hypothetical protein
MVSLSCHSAVLTRSFLAIKWDNFSKLGALTWCGTIRDKARRAMAGSMREKSAGTWEIRFEIGRDPANDRRRQLTRIVHGTRTEARAALRHEIAAVRAGNYRGSSTKFKALCATWLMLQSRNLGRAKVRSYESLLNSMVFPTLGTKSLNLIRASDLDDLYKKLALRKRLSPIEVGAVCVTLSGKHLFRRTNGDGLEQIPRWNGKCTIAPSSSVKGYSIRHLRVGHCEKVAFLLSAVIGLTNIGASGSAPATPGRGCADTIL